MLPVPAGAAAQVSACPRLSGGEVSRVARVFDGDTLELADGRRLRLLGVNTPERGRKGEADQSHAQPAYRWLAQRTKGKSIYWLSGPEKRDHYGRWLAHVYLDEGGLAAQGLVAAGLGHALAQGVDKRLLDCLFEAEEAAAESRYGVWQGAPDTAAAVRAPGFHLVSGRITRVTPTSRGTYLDLDNHLALFVPRDLLAARADGAWRTGQHLRVRGWIVDRLRAGQKLPQGRQRWLLKLTHLRHLQRPWSRNRHRLKGGCCGYCFYI